MRNPTHTDRIEEPSTEQRLVLARVIREKEYRVSKRATLTDWRKKMYVITNERRTIKEEKKHKNNHGGNFL